MQEPALRYGFTKMVVQDAITCDKYFSQSNTNQLALVYT